MRGHFQYYLEVNFIIIIIITNIILVIINVTVVIINIIVVVVIIVIGVVVIVAIIIIYFLFRNPTQRKNIYKICPKHCFANVTRELS